MIYPADELDELSSAENEKDAQYALEVVDLLVDDETHTGRCSVWQYQHFLDLHSHPVSRSSVKPRESHDPSK